MSKLKLSAALQAENHTLAEQSTWSGISEAGCAPFPPLTALLRE